MEKTATKKLNVTRYVRLEILDPEGPISIQQRPVAERFDLYWTVDCLLRAVTKGRVNFLNELNKVQSDDHENPVFVNKSDIPLTIVNLILNQYGLNVAEDPSLDEEELHL